MTQLTSFLEANIHSIFTRPWSQAPSHQIHLNNQPSIMNFFPTTSNVTREGSFRSKAPSRINQPSPLNPNLSPKDIIKFFIGSLTMIEDVRDVYSLSIIVIAHLYLYSRHPLLAHLSFQFWSYP